MKSILFDNIMNALTSIRSHWLRTILTMAIIAIGIMALVGMFTAIESLKSSISSSFSSMGANTFTIKNRGMRIHMGGGRSRNIDYRDITFYESQEFRNEFSFPAHTSVYVYGTGIATIKNGSKKTNPNVSVIGVDENYLLTGGYELEKGRNFTNHELLYGSPSVIIGQEIYNKVFLKDEDPIGKSIIVRNGKYRVIGLLKSKGSSMGMSGDRQCFVPLQNVRENIRGSSRSYSINVMPLDPELLDAAIGEATGLFNIVRRVKIGEPSNFEIDKSDNLAQMLIENLKFVSLAATIIGLITLMGAAIGLMNIMMVSVTERTREIGVRKAMGATRKIIRDQFLVEAIVICFLGGLVGIILGIIIGNVISTFTGGAFVIPWKWILLGISLCVMVGLISGIYPAQKAAKLNPIESLRYE